MFIENYFLGFFWTFLLIRNSWSEISGISNQFLIRNRCIINKVAKNYKFWVKNHKILVTLILLSLTRNSELSERHISSTAQASNWEQLSGGLVGPCVSVSLATTIPQYHQKTIWRFDLSDDKKIRRNGFF